MHTPGPWQNHANPVPHLGRMITRSALTEHAPGVHVGNVYTDADARLVTEAPTMADVLRTMVREYEVIFGSALDSDGGEEGAFGEYWKARALLARIDGETA